MEDQYRPPTEQNDSADNPYMSYLNHCFAYSSISNPCETYAPPLTTSSSSVNLLATHEQPSVTWTSINSCESSQPSSSLSINPSAGYVPLPNSPSLVNQSATYVSPLLPSSSRVPSASYTPLPALSSLRNPTANYAPGQPSFSSLVNPSIVSSSSAYTPTDTHAAYPCHSNPFTPQPEHSQQTDPASFAIDSTHYSNYYPNYPTDNYHCNSTVPFIPIAGDNRAQFDLYPPIATDYPSTTYNYQRGLDLNENVVDEEPHVEYQHRHSSRRRSGESMQPRTRIGTRSEQNTTLSQQYRSDCTTQEYTKNEIREVPQLSVEEQIEKEKAIWTRTTPADLFYVKDSANPKITVATARLLKCCDNFKVLAHRSREINKTKPKYGPPLRRKLPQMHKAKTEKGTALDVSEADLIDKEDSRMAELAHKRKHPDRLHPEMWYNETGEVNDGPACKCSKKLQKSGVRHGIYAGETHFELCNKHTNNADKLYHYRVTISPSTNFVIKMPTIITYDEHEFIFEGFSILSHYPLVNLPVCKLIRFSTEYSIIYIEEKMPDNFTILELDLFYEFFFEEILELVDLDLRAGAAGCARFHFMPRFVRELPENGKEILSIKEVLEHFLKHSVPLINRSDLPVMVHSNEKEWQIFLDDNTETIVTHPGKKPSSFRVDQLDRNDELQSPGNYHFPELLHFGIQSLQLNYAENPEYQKTLRKYIKYKFLLANMAKPSYVDKRKFEAKENKLQNLRLQSKTNISVEISAEGFYRTGIRCDMVQR